MSSNTMDQKLHTPAIDFSLAIDKCFRPRWKPNSEKRHTIIFISKSFYSIDMLGNSTVHFFDVTHWYVQIWALELKQHFLCYMIMVICHKSEIGFIQYDTICYHELCQNHNKLNSTQPCCCYRYLHVKGIFSTERKI